MPAREVHGARLLSHDKSLFDHEMKNETCRKLFRSSQVFHSAQDTVTAMSLVSTVRLHFWH